jgi:hypothetical protein
VMKPINPTTDTTMAPQRAKLLSDFI